LWWDVDTQRLNTASFYRLLTYPDWTWRLVIGCWRTQTELGGLWLDVVDLPRLNTVVYNWTLLTYPDWTRRFMIGHCWFTQTEHGGLWLDVVDLPRLNRAVYWLDVVDLPRLNTQFIDWTLLTYPDWSRRFMIGRCWLTQTEHGGLWLDVVDLPRLNTEVYDWTLLTYPDWTRRFMIGRDWLNRGDTAACDRMLTHPELCGLWLDVFDLPSVKTAACDWRLMFLVAPSLGQTSGSDRSKSNLNIKNFINFPFRQICPLPSNL
jgi:hypothetical protein